MSIWGTLAGIASSFIPGVGPLIAPLVSGGINALTSGGSGGTSNPQANQLAAQNLTNVQQESAYGKTAADSGFGQIQQASDTLNQPRSYFQSILNGDRANTTQTLAPQIQQIQQSMNERLNAGSTLDARGGGRASSLFSLPTQATSQINNLYNTARPAAATALTDIASRQGMLGTSLLNSSNGFYGGSNGATGSGLNNGLLTDQQRFDQSKQQGQAFGNIASGTNWGKIFKGLGGAASSSGGGGGGVDPSLLGGGSWSES